MPEPITPSLQVTPETPIVKAGAAETTAAEVVGKSSSSDSEVAAEKVSEVAVMSELSSITPPVEEVKAANKTLEELPAAKVAPAEVDVNSESATKLEKFFVSAGMPQPKASLWLSPRDPHSLLVSWEWQVAPPSGHPAIGLRLFEGQSTTSEPVITLELPRDVSHRFLSVGKGNTWFTAQIGFFQASGQWHSLAEALPVHTPSDQISPMAEVMMTQKVNESQPASKPALPSIPSQLSGVEAQAPNHSVVSEAEKTAVPNLPASATAVSVPMDHQPASQVCVKETSGEFAKLEFLPHTVQPELPPVEKATVVGEPGISAQMEPASTPVFPPSVAFQQPLGNSERWISSLEWAKQQGPQPGLEQSSPPGPPASSSLSGPPEHAPAKGKNYWLVAEVELIVYGATEPGSRVTLAGAEVSLRPDGSFSCRLALPAGRHEIPIQAVSPAGDDSRQIDFHVSRA